MSSVARCLQHFPHKSAENVTEKNNDSVMLCPRGKLLTTTEGRNVNWSKRNEGHVRTELVQPATSLTPGIPLSEGCL